MPSFHHRSAHVLLHDISVEPMCRIVIAAGAVANQMHVCRLCTRHLTSWRCRRCCEPITVVSLAGRWHSALRESSSPRWASALFACCRAAQGTSSKLPQWVLQISQHWGWHHQQSCGRQRLATCAAHAQELPLALGKRPLLLASVYVRTSTWKLPSHCPRDLLALVLALSRIRWASSALCWRGACARAPPRAGPGRGVAQRPRWR